VTKLDIIRNGILQYDFQTVLQIFEITDAVDYAERCLYDSDVVGPSGTFPLSGFIFQKTYAKWKAENKEAAAKAIEEIRDRDEKRRSDAAKLAAMKPKKEKTAKSKK
jgi:hypothetical protein